MKNVKVIAIALLAIVSIIIVMQNTASVETRLLFVTVTMPRALLLLLTLAAGFVLGLFTTLALQRRKPKPTK